ncbi:MULTISPECIES: FAD-dependent monooxygenase [unclassified Ruegeria]|uniref:FAD-dependent oxidoreductase n=1 Tax=unclassified Ruegeria TaxID=2625375 RepID=UPI001ADB0A5B|nr:MULTISPECIES: FAD-dependent monooxygenase [unclassified Ruegeria]MBO9410464.1 FAD-dependent monooxygenase [Ruegeria sp. R8_1]MBO9414317.1 FAD-dependent monooxygenase [Ruegeria sp. R8_2]
MNIDGLKFSVIGGGIGGLAAALVLRQRGAQVTVFEQAPALTEVGAGLQISANGMVVLRALGVVGAKPQHGQLSYGTVLRDYRKGRVVSRVPAPAAGPTYYYHRADLLDLLRAAAIEAGVDIRLGARVETVLKHPNEAELVLADGERLRSECTIAADGGRSAIRPILNGAEAPQFTHQIAWRATIPWSGHDETPRASLTMGPGRHVVTYPLRDQRLMNIVAIEERSDWQEEGWRLTGDPDDLRARFADFGGPVGDILSQVTQTHLWALFLRPVAQHWQNGRLALLGDAAHPTLPFMAQGACLALEDAWCLARAFEDQSGVTQALAAYEARRRPRATRVVAAAGANARNFHLRGPMRVAAQMALMAVGPQLSKKYEWIYSYDATA